MTATFKVRVTQIFRVERQILVDVEADSITDALEQATQETPAFKNSGWKENWTLENEDVDNIVI